MQIVWSPRSLADLTRLRDFLDPAMPDPATAMEALLAAVDRLVTFPRLGERLPSFRRREVRRLVVGGYEIHYEVQATAILIVRVYSTREQR